MRPLAITFLSLIIIQLYPDMSQSSTLVEIKLEGSEIIKSEPRKIVTSIFTVTNRSSQSVEFITEVNLPEKWRLITPEFPFTLVSNERDFRYLSFLIPHKAPAGEYEIVYTVKSKRLPSIQETKKITVVVLPHAAISLNILSAPEVLIVGEDAEAHIMVKNHGNSELTIVLAVSSSAQEIESSLGERILKLKPDESKEIIVSIKPDKKITKRLTPAIIVEASVKEDIRIVERAAIGLEVIPFVSGKGELYHKIPSHIRLSEVNNDDNTLGAGFQGEIQGQGTADEEGKHNIYYLIKGPNIEHKSDLGELNQYTARYWTDHYVLNLGHNSFTLSPLTLGSIYGFGVEGKGMISLFSLGSFYVEQSFLTDTAKTHGSYFTINFNKKNSLGLNFLNYLKTIEEKNNNDIISITGKFRPLSTTNIHFEYAGHIKKFSEEKAYTTGLSTGYSIVSYSGVYSKTYPNYQGNLLDHEAYGNSLDLQLLSNFSIGGSYSYTEENLSLNPTFGYALLEQSYSSSSSYTIPLIDTNVTLGVQRLERNDRFLNPSFDFVRDSMKINLGQRIGTVSMSNEVELGKSKNVISDDISDFYKVRFESYFSPFSRHIYFGSFAYSNMNFFGGKDKTILFSLGSRIPIAHETNFSLSIQNREDNQFNTTNYFDVSLSHIFFNKHSFDVHTLVYTTGLTGDAASFSLGLNYTIPFQLPIRKRKNIGSLEGYIFDVQTNRYISGLILRIADTTAVSDKYGKFYFPALIANTHYLRVETFSLGNNKIATLRMPYKVEIQAGKKKQLNIGITTAASVQGKVIVQVPKKTNVLKQGKLQDILDVLGKGHIEGKESQVYSLDGVLVELTNDEYSLYRSTGKEGLFMFEELIPGKWSLKIHSNNIPEYYYLKKDMFDQELKPGENKDMIIEVIPRERSAKVIKRGDLIE